MSPIVIFTCNLEMPYDKGDNVKCFTFKTEKEANDCIRNKSKTNVGDWLFLELDPYDQVVNILRIIFEQTMMYNSYSETN